ncbi:hypothetical protein DEO72_LG9g2537 [Vigna unguiculata]|uniref:Uncharacterized protein n=1 Tax=Vigna unguiculata TaxID=3917 RepID=A0A4D6N6B6_VIGUN|nr:hypothetical protein DEO72_LG9g2537 [Vigna unguiculata]
MSDRRIEMCIRDSSCDSVETMLLRNRPICVSRSGCGRNSRLGGRAGCTAPRAGRRNMPAPPPFATNSGNDAAREPEARRCSADSLRSRN